MADFPLPPGSTIGILGGGQLGRMLAMAAARLGFDVAILEPGPVSPAGRVSSLEICADYDDEDALEQLAASCDVVTFEFENVPAAALKTLAGFGTEVAPGPKALAFTQDRVEEKRFLVAHGVDTVAFEAIDSAEDIPAALERLGAPALLKTRREGYDGKGQAWVKDAGEAAAVFAAIGAKPAILEARADFVRELSVIAARGRDGQVAVYPMGENRHAGGVLRTTTAPAAVPDITRDRAIEIAGRILEGLDYVGVLGVELFELADGRLLVNEIAPRVHNTGHWTQDGCLCDQFEQHVRAVAGWPLGPTEARCAVEMENLLGADAERWAEIAAEPNAVLHLYGKGDARPGRKMGHVNRVKPLR
ncbi:5-(carboxyamino)imidazole ribonucleotide synthase [Caulobacter sp. 17J80-11]|uniref:5-(carboxyamino)imidazole ribonucleotide synthase n=1 Tax=Caulobacter sp. 17J80-11 TaxID=2763502 RepID=UPI0016536EE5|nr:5-(carboxyamino)imidazole ribonucleotide synthase [Caulobacter sp. 17J80-11]MBC6980251.1 5-(carboxyamino)imidazole ribonucleotide synthase [Caulobacter sp. 17J80-11]